MKTEKVLSILFIISLIFKLLSWPGSSALMLLSLTLLALCYFPFGFYFFSDKNFKNQNIGVSIIFGWFLSIAIIGIEFKLMHWPGANAMLIIGSLTAGILTIIAYKMYEKASEELKNYYKKLLLRASILGVFSLISLLIS